MLAALATANERPAISTKAASGQLNRGISMTTTGLVANALCLTLSLLANAPALAADVTDGKVVIGVLTDMSGPYADVGGKGSIEATRMAVEDFGGKVLGKPIEIVSADHQHKTDTGAGIARNWFDREGVDAVVDLNNTSVALAVNNLAVERNRLTLMTGTASLIMTNENCTPNSIHYVYDTYSAAHGVVKSMSELGKKSWFVLAADYAYGKGVAAALKEFTEETGAKLVGTVFHPLNSPDFSSFLLQAQASKADVIALGNASSDTVNSIKAAREFGLTTTQSVVPLLMYIQDVHALGLQAAQNLTFVTGFYWGRTPETRAWSKRFFDRTKQMPSQIQAGAYSAVTSYLKAVEVAGTDAGKAVAAKMKELPIRDMFAESGKVRTDGRMVHDMYLVQVKTPGESKAPWDYYKVLATIPGDEAFQPLSKSRCPLVTKP